MENIQIAIIGIKYVSALSKCLHEIFIKTYTEKKEFEKDI